MLANTKSSFISYTLTQDELAVGSQFNPEQRAVMQNIIADLAEEKIALKYDPVNPQQFLQREAELTGQIGILKYLLDLQSTMTEN
jgi:hypothetical protein